MRRDHEVGSIFARLGRFGTRYRWAILAVWIAAAAILTLFAPNIDKVSVNDQRAFLPEDVPSIQAGALLKEQFPERVSSNSAVIAIDAGAPGAIDKEEVAGYISSLTDQLQARLQDGTLRRVVSPSTADEQTAAALVSSDKQVALIVISFAQPVAGDAGHALVKSIAHMLNQPPPGVSAFLTGDAAILSAYDEAARNSVDSTTWLTIVLVVAMLLIVYRSPVSPLIPLATIALAYLISRAVIAILGASWLTISGYTNIFIIVVLFGAGTDYCLFLISRFREEMAVDHSARLAVGRTVGAVGETITSSAATVVVGLSTMAFAELGLYNTSGPSVAIAVLIAVIAGLTLTPALLSLLGAKAFWPRKAHTFTEGRIWTGWASWVTSHPLLVIVVVLIVLVPLAVYGQGLTRDFDLVADLSQSTPARQGYTALSQHLDAGATSPLTVLLKYPAGFDTGPGLDRLQSFERQIAGVEGVGSVTGFTTLLADRGTLLVQNQLGDLAKGVRDSISQWKATGQAGATGQTEGRSTGETAGSLSNTQLAAAAQGLTSIGNYLRQLAGQYPSVLQQQGFQKAVAALMAIARMAGVDTSGQATPSGTTSTTAQPPPASTPAPTPSAPTPSAPTSSAPTPSGSIDAAQALVQLETLAAGLEELQHSFASQDPPALLLPAMYLEQNEGLRNLRESYLSGDAKVARISVVLKSGPYTDAAMETVKRLRALTSDGSGVLVEGTASIMTDLRDASNRDMVRALVSVLLGIFLVLIWLLRSLVAPVYLLITILLSYASTLGIVRLVFVDWRGSPGITWWVPMFMFVMLVALGMDYNIFLMGRVKEEVGRLGNAAGIRRAVGRTGAIITSAGIIMAGTFAAMTSASILGLVQIGFAVTVGVLLDTFVVRTALVPAIAVLLGRISWWPGRVLPRRPQAKEDRADAKTDRS